MTQLLLSPSSPCPPPFIFLNESIRFSRKEASLRCFELRSKKNTWTNCQLIVWTDSLLCLNSTRNMALASWAPGTGKPTWLSTQAYLIMSVNMQGCTRGCKPFKPAVHKLWIVTHKWIGSLNLWWVLANAICGVTRYSGSLSRNCG